MEALELSVKQMEERIQEIKKKLGSRLYILGHHYQKDEVIQFADDIGDSLKLAQLAAENKEAEFIVFCGVHFMAETADILTNANQKVILPDLEAGCSMADMATLEQAEKAWQYLTHIYGDTIIPLTYVNSTAAIKAFVGRHGGATVTSSNAKKILSWAFTKKQRVLFLPDQHLGRNTAYTLGIQLDEMAVWDPIKEELELDGDVNNIKIILWKGHCGVHQNFTVEDIKHLRRTEPDMKIIVHPECTFEVAQMADENGSTNKIIQTIEQSESGSKWAIGTELNLVNRLKHNNPDKKIISLNPYTCINCYTMNKIDLIDLLNSLENIVKGRVVNQIIVDEKTKEDALLALNNMFMIK
ncbi:quinolinate synthase NadA [Tepidibacillus sp. LV47]|uniref:quinolinate synthase NadA n=1 Tax=Tepidibacillus sp. LV47 TaxID=3398228 RepID=UPI003AABFBD3